MSNKRKSIFDNIKRYSVASGSVEESLDDEMLQLESIDQEISKTLSTIHYNLDACNSIISSRFIPLLEKHRENCKNINDSTRFWKNLFENSLNVSIQVQPKKALKQDRINITDSDINISDMNSTLKENRAPKRESNPNNNNDTDSTIGTSILDISKSLQRYKNRVENLSDVDSSVSTNDEATSFGRKELSNVFSNNRSKFDNYDFLKDSIIEQNTSTLTYHKYQNQQDKLSPSQAVSSPSTALRNFKLKRTITGTTSDLKRQKNDDEETKRRRKSSAIMKKLNLDDSPEEIPKTPELTYLKFSPIKMISKNPLNHANISMNSTANNESTSLGPPPHLPSGLDDDTNAESNTENTESSILGKDISSSIYVDAPGSSNIIRTLNDSKKQKAGTNNNMSQLSIFDSSTSMHLRSPPVSMKFALPKSNIHLDKSPVKELARRYTEDYLDIAVDDDDDYDLDIPKSKGLEEDNNDEDDNKST